MNGDNSTVPNISWLILAIIVVVFCIMVRWSTFRRCVDHCSQSSNRQRNEAVVPIRPPNRWRDESILEREAHQREIEMERADRNANADPIPPLNNFLEERSSATNLGAISQAELRTLIPAGVIVKSQDGQVLAADFGDDDFTLLENKECVICLEEWDTDQPIRRSKHCSHVFHSECIFGWLKESRDCPHCREPFLPTNIIVSAPLEEEDNNGSSDVESGLARTNIITRSINGSERLFPSFLRLEERRAFLEDLLWCGIVSDTRENMLEVTFPAASSTAFLPATPCLICGEDWTIDAEFAQSPSPQCRHYYHRECILDHLLHTSSTCPRCHKTFVRADGNYR